MLLATKEILPDWDLLAPVFHVTAKGEEPAIQTQVSEKTPGPGGWGTARGLGTPEEETELCKKDPASTHFGDGKGLGR